MSARKYGQHPDEMGTFDPPWDAYMHYLYLPVAMPGHAGVWLPPELAFLTEIVDQVMTYECVPTDHPTRYVYVTARRGFASPGNPLNRPGWHADGFGTDDVNWIWSDRWPTRFATGTFTDISTDHVRSAQQFEEQIAWWERATRHQVANAHNVPSYVTVWSGQPNTLYRLTPDVIHATPIIEAPGGDRSFFKVSVSTAKYNLLGNSHNHRMTYAWRMYARSAVRNDPAYAGGDAGPQ